MQLQEERLVTPQVLRSNWAAKATGFLGRECVGMPAHLETGVDFQEVELGSVLVHEKLHSARAAIPGSRAQPPGSCHQLLPQVILCSGTGSGESFSRQYLGTCYVCIVSMCEYLRVVILCRVPQRCRYTWPGLLVQQPHCALLQQDSDRVSGVHATQKQGTRATAARQQY